MNIAYDFAIRGRTLNFNSDPFITTDSSAYTYHEDGAILIKADKIVSFGTAESFNLGSSPKVIRFSDNHLIMPSFVDSHIHYPQADIIGGYGNNLLEWLNYYAFKAEEKYGDPMYALHQAKSFLKIIINNGISAAGVFSSVHVASAHALFQAADEAGIHLTTGKTWMDRNCPEALQDTAQSAYDDSEALIERWHGKGHLSYAITPRFAITSSPAQLEAIAALHKKYPNTTIQSHISENEAELAYIKKLYPQATSYAELYHHYGLLNKYSIYGHGVLLSEQEKQLFYDTGASIAHCPTSNEFLGNKPFDLFSAKDAKRPLSVSLASDIGAGTSYCPWQTMLGAYRASRAHGQALNAFQALYLSTLGGAEALNIADKTGRFATGYSADLVVINNTATKDLAHRIEHVNSLEEELFALITLGTEQTIARLYVSGMKLK